MIPGFPALFLSVTSQWISSVFGGSLLLLPCCYGKALTSLNLPDAVTTARAALIMKCLLVVLTILAPSLGS